MAKHIRKSNPIDMCSKCGFCKANCPVLMVDRRESLSPRAFIIMRKEKVDSELFLRCTTCEACYEICPVKINVPEEVRKARSKVKSAYFEKMIKNIRETGDINARKKDVKELNCC